MHPQGQGKLTQQQCGMQFRLWIPIDLVECPYALFYSRGCHSHPPPPPNRAPYLIMGEILNLICRNQTPDLTLSKLSYLVSN